MHKLMMIFILQFPHSQADWANFTKISDWAQRIICISQQKSVSIVNHILIRLMCNSIH